MPETPPAGSPVMVPPAQPANPPHQPVTYYWATSTSTDPSNPANWYPDNNHKLPAVGDTVRMVGNTMTVHGNVLDGTNFYIGKSGTEVPMPDPVLNVTGGANLLLIGQTPADLGSHIQVNASGENALDILLPGSGQQTHPTKAAMDVNLAENSQVIGRVQVVDTAFNIRSTGGNTTFQLQAGKDSSLVRANHNPDGYVHIEPNMIGTGKMQMAFSNLDISGSVAPQVEIDLNQSSSLMLDHADTFSGIVKFAEHSGSVMTLKDFQFGGNYLLTGEQFHGTTISGRDVSFRIQYDSVHDLFDAKQTAGGLEIWTVPKG